MTSEPDRGPEPAHVGGRRRARRTAVVAAALGVVLLLGAVVLVPGHPPGLEHTSVLNVLFDDRWVVGGVRLVGLLASVYLLLSVVVRIEQDQWLKHIGPADVETDKIATVTEDQARLQDALDDANSRLRALATEYEVLLAQQAGEADTGGQAVDVAERGRTHT